MKSLILLFAASFILFSCKKEVESHGCDKTTFIKSGQTVFDADRIFVSDSEFKTSGVDFISSVMYFSNTESKWIQIPVTIGAGGVNIETSDTGTTFVFNMAPSPESVSYKIILKR